MHLVAFWCFCLHIYQIPSLGSQQRDVKKKKKNLNSFILPFVQWFSTLDTQYPTFISILDQQRSQWCNLSNCVYSWTSFGIATGTYSSGHWYHNRSSVHCDKYPSRRSFIILLWSSKSLDLSSGRSIWWWQLWSECSRSTEGKEFSMQRFPPWAAHPLALVFVVQSRGRPIGQML